MAAGTVETAAASLALRMSLFYGASFLISGLYGPYFSAWLRDQGLTAATIAIILALPMFASMVAGPLLAFIADSSARYQLVVQGLTVASLAGFLAPHIFPWAAGLTIIATFNAIAMPSIVPIGETFAIAGVQRFGLDYGRMRMWGSLMFVAANLVGGVILARFGSGSILWMMAVAASLTLAAASLLPRALAAGHTARLQISEVGGLLRKARFAWLLGAAGAIQCSHGFLNTFATLVWQDQGISASVIGLLWATAVISEVLLFAFARRPLARLGGSGMLVLGGAAALVRWIAFGFDPPLPLIFVLQALHGLSFGATHMGAIHEMSQQIPPKLSATAQGIYAAATSGIATGMIVVACGLLYAHAGVQTYWAMAVVSALGLVLALKFRALGSPPAPA